MTTTNRDFDDAHALTVIDRKFGIKIPHDLENLNIEVSYDAPIANGKTTATVEITLSLEVTSDTADEILNV